MRPLKFAAAGAISLGLLALALYAGGYAPGSARLPLASRRVTPAARAHVLSRLEKASTRDDTRPPHAPPQARAPLALAQSFRDGKQNAFFDRAAFIDAALRQDPHTVDALRGALLDTRSLALLPDDAGHDWSQEKPLALTQRMAAIDFLEALAQHQDVGPAARDALEQVFHVPLAKLAGATQKALLGEKYDALTALTHVDAGRAFALYTAIDNPRLAAMVQDALVAGLIDAGLPRADAVDLVRESRKD